MLVKPKKEMNLSQNPLQGTAGGEPNRALPSPFILSIKSGKIVGSKREGRTGFDTFPPSKESIS
jgi:hypothetical protein